ncbi:unnamed protein product [Prorocentrum cordatum]|uniref:CCR4-NOT transcription complex subunit 10 n=1 Tax=Prorocentrum cordatum TaxID=2364126 RepID=A0ABN9SIP7_9DINO|nr:unnamed protein product [Polarella glacialis]
MLMCERPAGALKCFEQCAPVFRTWPRLWLRMAECCIELHSQGLARAPCDGPAAAEGGGAGACSSWSHVAARPPAHGTLGSSGGARQLCWSVQGGGPHRRWLLSTARSPPIGRRVAGEDDEGEKKGDRAPDKPAAAPHAPRDAGAAGERPPLVGEGALAHAAMCLRNVLVLTAAAAAPAVGSGAAAPGAGAGEKAGGMSGGSGGGLRAGKASGAGGGSRHHTRDVVDCEASLLEDAALVKLAYVSLCQNDHAAALRCSRRFLEKGLMLPKEAGKEHGRSQSPSAAAVVSEDAEDARKQWTFQAQSLSSTAAAGAAHERESSRRQLAVPPLECSTPPRRSCCWGGRWRPELSWAASCQVTPSPEGSSCRTVSPRSWSATPPPTWWAPGAQRTPTRVPRRPAQFAAA